MEDLRILEEHQQESKRQLESVRLVKQRRLEQYAALETKLRDFKYRHAQDRVEIQRMHQSLSVSQRLLSNDRVSASKAGDYLREFDGMLKKAIACKRRLTAQHHMKCAKIELLRHKLVQLKGLVHHGSEKIEKAKIDCEQVKQLDASLRQALRDKTSQVQNVVGETATARSKNAQVDHEINANLKVEAAAKQRMEASKMKLVEKEQKIRTLAATTEKQQQDHCEHMRDQHGKTEKVEADASRQMENNRLLDQKVVEIQVAEKHIVPSAVSSSLPVKQLDLGRIRSSEQEENKALKDEENAKKAMESSVETLRSEFAKAQPHEQAISAKATKEKDATEESKRTEDARRKSIGEDLKKYAVIKQEVRDLEEVFTQQKEDNEKQITELQEESGEMHKVVPKAKKLRDDRARKLEATNSEIAKCEKNYDKAKKVDAAKLESERKKLLQRRAKLAGLAEEIRDTAETGTFRAEDEGETDDELRAKIAELLDGTCS